MDQEKFIKQIKTAVEQSAINGVISTLKAPAGRQPEQSLVQISNWFNKLNIEEKENITKIIQLSVTNSVFGFLCILDGVRSIRDTVDDDDSILRLTYTDSKKEVLLNDPKKEFLHDIYKFLNQ